MLKSDSKKRTNQNIFELFESLNHTQKQIEPIILGILDDLKIVLDSFKPKSKESKGKLETILKTAKNKNVQTAILKASDILELDELKCYEYYQELGYTQNSEISIDIVIDDIISHYFQERTSLLNLIIAIFQSIEDESESNIHQELAKKVVDQLLKDDKFINNILSQYHKVALSSIPDSFASNWNKSTLWVKQNLIEQKCLLKILFLIYYSRVMCSPKQVIKITNILIETKFGLKQNNQAKFDKKSLELSNYVSHLAIILFIEILHLETVLDDIILPSPPVETHLFSSPHHIIELHNIIQEINYQNNVGPIFIAWAAFLSRISQYLDEQQSSLEGEYEELANFLKPRNGPEVAVIQAIRARQCDVFQYLLHSLKGPCYAESEDISIGYKSVLKGFFTIIMVGFEIQNISDFDTFVECTIELYDKQVELCNQFWSEDYYHEERRSFLDITRARFPAQFNLFIRLLNSLASGPKASMAVFQYLCEVPTFTNIIDNSRLDNYVINGQTYVTKKDQVVIPDSNDNWKFVIPGETMGRLVSNSAPYIIQWQYNYSAWHFFFCIIENFLQMPIIYDNETNLEQSKIITVTLILQLLKTILTECKEAGSELIYHFSEFTRTKSLLKTEIIGQIIRVLNRSVTLDNPPEDLITSCVYCLKAFLPNHSHEIWTFLHQSTIIPRFSFNAIDGVNKIRSQSTNGGLQRLLQSKEMTDGKYPITLAFLDLITTAISEIQQQTQTTDSELYNIKLEVLYWSISYLQSDIFPCYDTWRYVNNMEKFKIGLQILHIFNTILEKSPFYASKSDNKDSATSKHSFLTKIDSIQNNNEIKGNITFKMLQNSIINTFLLNGTLYHLTPLLNVIGTGQETIKSFYLKNQIKEAQELEKLIISSFKFVKYLIQYRRHCYPSVISFLEQALLDKIVYKNDAELITIIASYANYEYNVHLCTNAINTLNELCISTAQWGKNRPSFVGYFTSTLCRQYIDIMLDDKQSDDLHIALWTLMISIIQIQHGLAKILLTGNIDRFKIGSNTVKDIEEENKENKDKDKVKEKEDNKDNINKDNNILAIKSKEKSKSLNKKDDINKNSILSAIIKALDNNEQYYNTKLDIMLLIYKLLDLLWQNALNYYAILEKLRKQDIWTKFSNLIFKPYKENSEEFSLSIDSNGQLVSTWNDTTKFIAYHYIINSYILRILAMELHLCLNHQTQINKENDPLSNTSNNFKDLFNKIIKNQSYKMWLESLFTLSFDKNQLLRVYDEWKLACPSIDLDSFSVVDNSSGNVSDNTMTMSIDNPTAISGSLRFKKREYGDRFLFDIHLINSKFCFVNVNEKVNEQSNLLLRICLLNHKLSLLDAQYNLLRSWKCFIELSSAHLGNVFWTISTKKPVITLFDFIQIVAEKMKSYGQDKDYSSRSELCFLLLFLMNKWKSMLEKETTIISQDDIKIEDVKSLLSLLILSLQQNNSFTTYEFGQVIDRSYYISLFSLIYFTLRSYKLIIKKNKLNIDCNLKSSCHTLFPIICSFYGPMLRSLAENNYQGDANDVRVVSSLITELIHSNYGLNSSIWLPIVQRCNIIQLLLNVFCTSISSSINGDPVITKTVLYVIQAFSNSAAGSERLALEGCITIFTNNSLSPIIQKGNLEPYIVNGSEKKRNPWHQIWCLINSITTSMLTNLRHSQNFIREVIGFMGIYENQIIKSLQISDNEPITFGQLEEIVRITELGYQLGQCCNKDTNLNLPPILYIFISSSLDLFQNLIYLLQHTRILTTRAVPFSNDEKEMNNARDSSKSVKFIKENSTNDDKNKSISTSKSTSLTSLSKNDNDNSDSNKDDTGYKSILKKSKNSNKRSTISTPFIENIEYLIIKAVRNLLACFRVFSNANFILKESYTQWNDNLSILAPTMNTYGPCSFGTMLDCLSQCQVLYEYYNDNKSETFEHNQEIINDILFIFEHTTLILVTQIALVLRSQNQSYQTKIEIKSEANELKNQKCKLKGIDQEFLKKLWEFLKVHEKSVN
ncbi:hypothetical protein BCR32DRAFT_290136 [Anaeromyces robustus]|uniref:Nucleoporin Nup188 N-terminal subdomain III domain-containing protein n=1 Tax=Anaeromyces robustus TaxID=1754192 RepID=A0A1Y1XKJ7_9FUNG|nr:hypothetical protein BCR32DRAFT_290136 [Anaeromyces robustus]|eukprot:ORX86287.1 hypothetical protein BCR32DRAFT_290136 [Anaeromyces robustus]